MAYNSPHTEAICTLIHTLYKKKKQQELRTPVELFTRVQLRPFLHIISKDDSQNYVLRAEINIREQPTIFEISRSILCPVQSYL